MHLHDLLVNRQRLKPRESVRDVLNHRVGRVLKYLVVLHGGSTHGSNLRWDVGGHGVGRGVSGLCNGGVGLHIVGLNHGLRILLGLYWRAHYCHLSPWICIGWNMRRGSHRNGGRNGLRGTGSARSGKGSRVLIRWRSGERGEFMFSSITSFIADVGTVLVGAVSL